MMTTTFYVHASKCPAYQVLMFTQIAQIAWIVPIFQLTNSNAFFFTERDGCYSHSAECCVGRN